MKTTINISDRIMREVKREAARRGVTMGQLIESALRLVLEEPANDQEFPSLPTFSSGGTYVNVADRKALYDVMEK